jgi:hypothetical protein
MFYNREDLIKILEELGYFNGFVGFIRRKYIGDKTYMELETLILNLEEEVLLRI